MSSMATAARSTRPPSAPPRDFLAEVKQQGSKLPNRVLLHGVEGIGKTSFAASAPRPIFIMARGETGLETLIDHGRVVETPHFPEAQTWEEVLGAVRSLITGTHDYRALVIDTLNGVERLCHEHVCRRDFGGDWGEHGFASYGKGAEVALADWRELLSLLDRLRAEKRMALLALAHTKVKTFKNPEGPDYDRYTVDMNEKTWGLTHKWSDVVLFANFLVETQKEKGSSRTKGVGGQDRYLFTERHAAWDAKNRIGLPESITMGRSGAEAWANFIGAARAARTTAPAAPEPGAPAIETETTTEPAEVTV